MACGGVKFDESEKINREVERINSIIKIYFYVLSNN